jgi:hypothetical protein
VKDSIDLDNSNNNNRQPNVELFSFGGRGEALKTLNAINSALVVIKQLNKHRMNLTKSIQIN